MFSIRWIAGNGSEMIYPAENVSFTPHGFANGAGGDTKPSKAIVAFDTDGTHCTIDSGRLYVMNATGKTVATYILEGDAEFPHGYAPFQRAAA